MNYILLMVLLEMRYCPLHSTRPVDILIGIVTIRKWEMQLGSTTTTLTEEYLSEKYPMVELEENVMINASFLPTPALVDMICDLGVNQAIFKGEDVVLHY
jgi:hypothetical protein